MLTPEELKEIRDRHTNTRMPQIWKDREDISKLLQHIEEMEKITRIDQVTPGNFGIFVIRGGPADACKFAEQLGNYGLPFAGMVVSEDVYKEFLEFEED